MDAEQVENAIRIAWNPQSDQSLRMQANLFVNQLRSNSSAWQICLPLFTRSPPPADEIRHFCLEVVNYAAQSPEVDESSKDYIRTNMMSYVQAVYGANGAQGDTAHIQNKLAQTLTYLFTALYPTSWTSFFDDLLGLARNGTIGEGNTVAATVLYLRLLGSISDEIADVLIPRTPEEGKRNTELKDLIRARDAQKIALSWQELLAKWRSLPQNIVELCLKTISRWASWIDIGLVADRAVVDPLLQMAGQEGLLDHTSPEVQVRNAAVDAFTEIASKKMRPQEKLDLINFLNLGTIVAGLVRSPPLSDDRNTPRYDVDLAELVAKMVNNIIRDVVNIFKESNDEQTIQRADSLLQEFVPFLLRFFSDEYDEVCSTVIDSVTEILQLFRNIGKKGPIPPQYSALLPPILEAIIAKMKFDETAAWGDEGEELDQEEFEALREKLAVLQQNIAAVDETLYMETLSRVVVNAFNLVDTTQGEVEWQQLDLALHEMYLFGDLATKNRGLYQKKKPSGEASRRLIEMMIKMLESRIAAHPHPAIQLQYIELCVRYVTFFEENPTFIPPVLENFVRFMHSNHQKVRARSWYLFLRFVRSVKGRLGEISLTIMQAISDLLIIKAKPPETGENDDDDDTETSTGSTEDRIFNAQLNLFEAVGYITAAPSNSPQNRVMYTQSVLKLVLSDIEQAVGPAKSGNEQAILQIHHDMVAIGAFARGISDWTPGAAVGTPPSPEIADEFSRAADVVIAALESLNTSSTVREAARFTLARLIGVLGSRILESLPRWIDGLLAQSSSRDEMATFLKLFEQMIFSFRTNIAATLDAVLGPLTQRAFDRLAQPPTGTDDEIELGELRREFVNFVLQCLNQDMAHVFVSPANQSRLDGLISALELFARDPSNYTTAKLSFSVFTRMTAVWGGPDVPLPGATAAEPNSPVAGGENPPATSQPAIPGFDAFAIARFSPLSWAIPSDPHFRIRDPAGRGLVHEIAALQQEILKKTGGMYLEALGQELRGMGMSEMETEGYLVQLRGDSKAFKDFLVGFLGRGGE